jgi:hypothetical protein
MNLIMDFVTQGVTLHRPQADGRCTCGASEQAGPAWQCMATDLPRPCVSGQGC